MLTLTQVMQKTTIVVSRAICTFIFADALLHFSFAYQIPSHESSHQANGISHSLPLQVTKAMPLHVTAPRVHHWMKVMYAVWCASQKCVFSRQVQHNDTERATRVASHRLDQTTPTQYGMPRAMNEYDD